MTVLLACGLSTLASFRLHTSEEPVATQHSVRHHEVIHASYYQGFDRLSEQLIAQAQTLLLKSMFNQEQSSTHPVERDGLVKRSGLPPGTQRGQLRD